ncbi:Crp/Fnr family transcriptional regulator [Salegentibacter maritimus]|uniref:Crp/Fnr family transcriptional regulator n=1 Tax=Salegentibacter maritimus TaxID=2794347 RepID=UPI0018E4A6DD|nr:Crp/Fnr family transcriptional regulator [Salegentibacter maritimus]MBI6117298.1 Crp/Fnr family transcriptional regulator [Salegentibacter maritimus]
MKCIVFCSEKVSDIFKLEKSSILKECAFVHTATLKDLNDFLISQRPELIIWDKNTNIPTSIFRNKQKSQSIPLLSIIPAKNLDTWHPIHNRHKYVLRPYSLVELQHKIKSLVPIQLQKNQTVKNSKRAIIPDIKSLKTYIQQQGEPVKWDKNKIIFRENRHSSFIYLVNKGLLKTFRMDQLGKELITGIYRKNELLGLYGFHDNLICPETASSIEASTAYRFPYKSFKELLENNPNLGLDLAQLLTDTVLRLKSQLLEMAYASVLKKTSTTILQFADDLKQPDFNGLKISRTDLASMAGISPESFIRSLSCLKKEGIIAIKGKNINILNSERLQEII